MEERPAYTILGALLLVLYLFFYSIYDSRTSFGFRIPIPWLQPDMSFITRNGTRFLDSKTGSPVYLNGWNSYWMVSSDSSESVREMMRRGSAMGMSVCRTWAFNDGGPNALQLSPGVFDERIFQDLDYVIYEARRNNIRLILSLVNNLNNFGGKDQYVRWAQAAGADVSSTDSFFSHPTLKRYYKDYVKAILSRKNAFSGIKYAEEPAIFAWELMNEPRCASNSSAPLLQAWIAEMSTYIKSLDPNHLTTIGLEGFYSHKRTEKSGINPGKWASLLGSDFIQNSATKHIDFASVHAYPDIWIPNATLHEKIEYLSSWVDSHINDCEHVLKKPVLFTEVGSQLEVQKNGLPDGDVLLQTVYDKVYESAKRGKAGNGALIWQLMVEEIHGFKDEFSLVAREHPAVYKLIVKQSCRLKRLFGRNVSSGAECSGMMD